MRARLGLALASASACSRLRLAAFIRTFHSSRSIMAAAAASSSEPLPHTASTSAAALAGERVPSLSTRSVWSADAVQRSTLHPRLQGDDPTLYDACVVGGGIVGVSVAYDLAKAGLKVALMEARTIGTGTTGWSTAKLTAQQNLLYTTLAAQHGKDAARLYGEMQMEAIAKAESLDRELGLHSKFSRIPHATWTSSSSILSLVQAEAELAKSLGLPAEFLSAEQVMLDLPKSVDAKGAVRFTQQAQFNPITYAVNLAGLVSKTVGCIVFESTRVTSIGSDAPHTVTAEHGTVKAKHVVLGTHLPIMDRSGHFSLLSVSRTVCIAVRLEDPSTLPKNMWISDSSTPIRSMRVVESGELVIAGESFDQGNCSDTNSKYDVLEKFAKEHWRVAEVTHRWSAMDYISSTHMPYIGFLHRGTTSLYTATGMSKWGLANGVAAGSIIRDLILGGEGAMETNRYAKLVDARRWDLLKAGLGAMKESAHVTTHLIGDKVKALFSSDISKLRRGEGSLVKVKGESVGAYLDDDGKYHLVKPVCTHLGCNVIFNQGDKVWDCPCHGSQFTVDGEIIQGPACKKLPSMNHLEW